MEETLGKRISSHRKHLTLTQDALAEKLGVTAQAVSKWENDQSCPDITMLPKLAEIFGCSTDSLLGIPEKEAVRIPPVPAVCAQDEAEPEDFNTENGTWEFKWDSGRRGSLALGLWVLLLGIYLAVGNFLGWNLYWVTAALHTGLTVFGLFGLYPRFSLIRLGCFSLGLYYLLRGIGYPVFALSSELLLPIIMILLGLHLLVRAFQKKNKPAFFVNYNGRPFGKQHSSCEYHEESFLCSTTFGNNHHLITLPRLSGGKAVLSFGQLEIDLSGCEEIAEGCRLDLDCSFGEMELTVPGKYRIEPNISTAFAALDIEGTPSPDPVATIYVNGSVHFGELTLRYL